MKVLFLGYCSLYTVSNLAKALKKNITDFTATIANPVKPDESRIHSNELSAFDNVIHLPRRREVKINGNTKLRELKHILKAESKRRRLLKNIVKTDLQTAKKYINSEAEERKYSERMKSILAGHDIYNFHYPTPQFLTPLKYIGRDKKIMLSFWGSDLLRTESTDNYIVQREAFDRADVITMNTIEMREIFLAKFGRKYLPKIRQAYYIVDESKFQDLKAVKQTFSDSFKEKNGIARNKILVSLGYSGSSCQRHIEILNLLKSFDKHIKNKIHIAIPMMYGLQFEEKNYSDKVRAAAETSGITYTILDKYLQSNELKELVSACQINLNLRDTDSMNGSFLESLNAGNINICGAWLPYGKLRRLGVRFFELEKREELLTLLPYIIENLESELAKNSSNGEAIREFFRTSNLIKDWEKIFHELNENVITTNSSYAVNQ